ncbi:hypothetical protein M427DRAFT_55003 [Gonapodya prolifera JEL478]|uniref:Uncharacterized protein n=1 Tax=Gonapodya prolifera (strain JEL478) TaxID=1344416 RepID=A0A139AJL4_GONPJ|nr:hypothetical protein M427DRAFT_55003 [Gonapodya prolifera JEL478]|eukprot:KXS16972.1 hypothetical protein M427DRAFT_55003 [Gonapodya prolifera JEL478]
MRHPDRNPNLDVLTVRSSIWVSAGPACPSPGVDRPNVRPGDGVSGGLGRNPKAPPGVAAASTVRSSFHPCFFPSPAPPPSSPFPPSLCRSSTSDPPPTSVAEDVIVKILDEADGSAS